MPSTSVFRALLDLIHLTVDKVVARPVALVSFSLRLGKAIVSVVRLEAFAIQMILVMEALHHAIQANTTIRKDK